jgi:AcrR family transcriptional regulator
LDKTGDLMNNSGKEPYKEHETESTTGQASGKNEDRRIQRTRQALQHAFKEVLREKGFTATTVQDITERANVNRGTFYIHFADKYALTTSIIRQNFQAQLPDQLPPNPGWNKLSFERLVRFVLGHFESKYQHRPASLSVPTSLFEQTVREELDTLLLGWLKQSPSAAPAQSKQEMVRLAQVVCWTIFGAALQWSQEEMTFSADEMTTTIIRVVLEGVSA